MGKCWTSKGRSTRVANISTKTRWYCHWENVRRVVRRKLLKQRPSLSPLSAPLIVLPGAFHSLLFHVRVYSQHQLLPNQWVVYYCARMQARPFREPHIRAPVSPTKRPLKPSQTLHHNSTPTKLPYLRFPTEPHWAV